MEPGIYFGLPDEAYHAVPALSNSGIKHLRTSTLDYWVRSFMNPDYEPEESPFMEAGKAYHRRILEGRERFYESYAAQLDPLDYPEALRTVDDIKARLKELDLKVSGRKDELVERLLLADPEAQVWDELVADHKGDNAGKTLLSHELITKIEKAARMIECHPELSKCFRGGHPEVSVFWEDDDVPMKARVDYLKPRAIIDLKTFGNQYGKPIDEAVATAVANERYHIQAAVYTEAVERAKGLIVKGAVHGLDDQAWLRSLVENEQQFVFVFQQTGVAPVARGKVFPRMSAYDIGKICMTEAIQIFRECREVWGEDPWIDKTPITTFDDAEFPAYLGRT